MGDSWISPTDSVDTWGEYLFAQSIVDEHGRDRIDAIAKQAKNALEQRRYAVNGLVWCGGGCRMGNRTEVFDKITKWWLCELDDVLKYRGNIF